MLDFPSAAVMPLQRDEYDTIRVGGTRVTLETVIGAFHRGASPEEIVYQYPALGLGDVYQVVGYYLQNHIEVDEYVSHQREAAAEVRREAEAHHPNIVGLRERLLARLNEQK